VKRVTLCTCLILCAVFGFSDSNPNRTDFVGTWYDVNLDNKVDLAHSLSISDHEEGFLVKYVIDGKASIGIVHFSTQQRGLIGEIVGYGKVVIRKVKSNGSLSMDLLNDFEDVTVGFFQKREVLEKLLGKKLP